MHLTYIRKLLNNIRKLLLVPFINVILIIQISIPHTHFISLYPYPPPSIPKLTDKQGVVSTLHHLSGLTHHTVKQLVHAPIVRIVFTIHLMTLPVSNIRIPLHVLYQIPPLFLVRLRLALLYTFPQDIVLLPLSYLVFTLFRARIQRIAALARLVGPVRVLHFVYLLRRFSHLVGFHR